MSDEEYNRIFGAVPKPTFSLLFAICIAVVCLLFWSIAKADVPQPEPYVDEKCAFSFACQETTYQLWYWGQVISTEDQTLEECMADLEDIKPQIAPFGGLECRARMVERQSL